MKKFGAFKVARFVLAATIAVAGFATSSLNFAGEAHASAARLQAIKRVEGLHERKNRKAIQAMVGINPATTPWCGAAAAYAVRKAGGDPVKYPNKAANWKSFGKGVSLASARPGDVVVLRFKRGYHVGIYSKKAGNGRIEVCGGNMSNKFKCSNYRTANVKAVRR